MNYFLAGRTIRYILASKHKDGHGIHSPFVYSIITEVLKNKVDPSLVNIVESLRKDQKLDRRRIDVNDLGSGSLKNKSNNRKVSDIAKYAAVRPKYGSLLSKLAASINGKSIIELGTSLGIGTMYLTLGAPDSRVITIEGCENIASLARENFKKHASGDIESICGNFDDVLDETMSNSGRVGLVYIDGNHRSTPLKQYFNTIRRYIDEDTIIIVDDIHYSRDMENGWNEIKGAENVSVSIDLLQMGLLFFRSGIRKQSFMIRY